MLASVLSLMAGLVVGVFLLGAWLWRDEAGRTASGAARRQRRRDRVREAMFLAQENLYSQNAARGLRWARRAVRLDRCNPQAHAVLASCLDGLQRFERGLCHHRRAEYLDAHGDARTWRFQNALEAVQACMQLRGESAEADAQTLWDEAAAWARLAHSLDPDEAQEALAVDPWLTPFASGGEEWLKP